MKTKKLKLLTTLLLLLPLCVVLLGAGCDDDDGEYTEIELYKFSDFGCENDNQWSLNTGYYNDNYIITSQEEFEEIVNLKCTVDIDFSNYTLLIGSKTFGSGASLYDEKVEENNSEIVYTVTFREDDSQATSLVNYHVVIENSSGKDIRIEEAFKESE